MSGRIADCWCTPGGIGHPDTNPRQIVGFEPNSTFTLTGNRLNNTLQPRKHDQSHSELKVHGYSALCITVFITSPSKINYTHTAKLPKKPRCTPLQFEPPSPIPPPPDDIPFRHTTQASPSFHAAFPNLDVHVTPPPSHLPKTTDDSSPPPNVAGCVLQPCKEPADDNGRAMSSGAAQATMLVAGTHRRRIGIVFARAD